MQLSGCQPAPAPLAVLQPYPYAFPLENGSKHTHTHTPPQTPPHTRSFELFAVSLLSPTAGQAPNRARETAVLPPRLPPAATASPPACPPVPARCPQALRLLPQAPAPLTPRMRRRVRQPRGKRVAVGMAPPAASTSPSSRDHGNHQSSRPALPRRHIALGARRPQAPPASRSDWAPAHSAISA